MLYSIRKTCCSDIPYLIEVEKSATLAFLSVPDLSWLVDAPVLSEQMHYELINTIYAFVISNDEGKVVGFIYAKQQDQDFYIIEFDVRSDLQKQGIGRQLIEYAISVAKAENFSAVTLTTFADVAWNGLFYQRLGFEILKDSEQSHYLKNALDNEVKFGFRRESRCAMQFTV